VERRRTEISWFDFYFWAYAEYFGLASALGDFQADRLDGSVRIVDPVLRRDDFRQTTPLLHADGHMVLDRSLLTQVSARFLGAHGHQLADPSKNNPARFQIVSALRV
jgi:hypothetical protein